ncbi:unnamed protein product [Musa acuminata subsp. malaccensis]|uniref:(wild Malaysian banana) hypothetical protein n=1 Tax=Musa acuminata subsp. malaccensis TaxID=214687 RepID=A0A804IWK3_MUSAM|nr:unnamed protein product [Musa acuminata subsp. malaccensis]
MSSSKPAGSIHDFTVRMPREMMWILAFTKGRSC